MVGGVARWILEVLALIVAPTVVGVALTRWAGASARRRGWSPPGVRGIRVLVTAAWVSVVIAGIFLVIGPIGILSTLTVSAIAGIAVTLALQTTLQNLVAGLILYRQGVIRLGDVVDIGGVHGRIAGIGLLSTVLMLESGALAFLSNSNILAGPLVNHTAAIRLAGDY